MTYYDNSYLTDQQYIAVLKKIKKTVDSKDFKPKCYDSTTLGAKYTESNCGFCNDNYASEKDGSAHRKAFRTPYYLKDRRKGQACPFDLRKKALEYGCFYKCYLFKGGKDIKWIRTRVDKILKEAERKLSC